MILRNNIRSHVDKAKQQETLEQEQGLTQEAIERQYFGAPTYVYQGEPFWGQDRIDLLDEVIHNRRKPIPFPPV